MDKLPLKLNIAGIENNTFVFNENFGLIQTPTNTNATEGNLVIQNDNTISNQISLSELNSFMTNNSEFRIPKNVEPTICLNMIVKNESRIIKRLLDSVIHIIDTYCICDTGSTDNTVELITSYFNEKSIPGLVFFEPFKNFGYNRTVSLQKARTIGADYLLFLDADMRLQISPQFQKSILREKGYQVMQKNAHIQYYNLRIIHSSIDTKCVGVTHEYYDTPGANIAKLEPEIMIINDIGDGGAKSNKYERDVMLLEQGLKDLENSPNPGLRQRYLFYLANTYLDSGVNEKAANNYKLRIEAGGWHEEVFYAYLKLGQAYKNMGRDAEAIYTWMNGYNFYNKRAESIYEIVKHYRLSGKNLLAWQFYLIGKSIPFPKDDVLFINYGVYEYLLDYEASIVIYYIPTNLRNGINPNTLITRMLKHDRSIDNWCNVLSNYKFYYPKLTEMLDCETRNFTSTCKLTFGEHEHTMRTSTPCVFYYNNKWYMNIRWVNYFINDNGSYNYDKDKIITTNELVELDDNMEICARRMFNTEYIDNERYQGIEDCKVHIFPDGIARFMGTICNGNLTIGYGIYPINNSNVNELEVVPCKSPIGANCEKNWVMIGDQVIYKWHPLTIGKLKKDGKMWNFVKEKETTSHWIFKDVRGSSNACWLEDRQEWWLVVHMVEYGNPRIYYHMLVILDKEKNIKTWSKMFKFGDDKIEYCLGLGIRNGKIMMSYSGWDRTCKLSMWSLEKIEKEMFV
jgi:tetratricopeptide (TPR) repeat protein